MDEKKEWYLVRHSTCGAYITLESKTFSDSFNSDRNDVVKCPNCNKTLLNSPQKDRVLAIFKEKQLLSAAGIEINRLEEDSPQGAVLSILKALK